MVLHVRIIGRVEIPVIISDCITLRSITYLLLSSMMTSCSGLATAELSKTLLASVSEIDSDSAAEEGAALNELEERGDEGGVETRCFTANSRLIA